MANYAFLNKSCIPENFYMKQSGGTFTGEVQAQSINTTSNCLRNSVVYASDATTVVSTNYIQFVRK